MSSSDREITRKTGFDNHNVIVCIPAFNEENTIGKIVLQAKLYANEVIVCDDGSKDLTVQSAKAAGAVVVRHPINKGYGAAIKTLFRTAKERGADVMVTLDGDEQHDPRQIPDLIKPILEEDYDVVVGSRFLKESDSMKVPGYRSFGIKTITRLSQMTTQHNLTDAQSGFRAYSKNALSRIDLTEEGMAVSTEILIRAAQNNLLLKEVPVTVKYDVDNASAHNPFVHGMVVLVSLLRFMSLNHPLAFYGLPGVAFLLVAGYFVTSALDLFSATRYVSTNMIIIAVGSAVIGMMLLATSIILYTMTALLKEKLRSQTR